MKKLYSEKQYREYCEFMDRIANTDDIMEGYNIHLELNNWIISNDLLEIVIDQMDQRLEDEFIRENSDEPNEDFKVIEFPQKSQEE